MLRAISYKRPTCEEILKKKDLWTLNKDELEFNDELENIIASKESENEFTIYSLLKSKINLIENSDSSFDCSFGSSFNCSFDSSFDYSFDSSFDCSFDSSSKSDSSIRVRTAHSLINFLICETKL
jgi:hypothetical protein